MSTQPRFRAGTTFTTLDVTSEPYLALTFRGYTGAVEVRDLVTGTCYELLIGGIKSLAESLEPLRASNDGAFTGLRFRIKKQSEDRFSPYVVVPADGAVSPTTPEAGKAVPTEEKIWNRITTRYRA